VADPSVRLGALARERDPERVFAAVCAASPETIDPTLAWTLRRIAAVFAGEGHDTALRASAALGYLTGRVALGVADRGAGGGEPDLGRAQRLLARVEEYDIGELEAALGPLAERPLAIAGDDAANRGVLLIGVGVALAEDELAGGADA